MAAIFDNNLFTLFQNVVGAPLRQEGQSLIPILRVTNNTYWCPAYRPVNVGAGMRIPGITSEIQVRNNIFVMDGSVIYQVQDNGSVQPNNRIDQKAILNSDYNLVYQRDGATGKFVRLNGMDRGLTTWQRESGRDANSKFNELPVFVNEPTLRNPLPNPGNARNNWGWDRAIPRTVGNNFADLQTIRAWFGLSNESPGKRAASDGSDMGIRPLTGTSGPTGPTGPTAPRNLRITADN
jgi:hypothetical protein